MINIFADGIFHQETGTGGWAVRIENGSELLELNGGMQDAEAAEMELTAIVQALEAISGMQVAKGASITLYSCSSYAMEGITESMLRWKAAGWKRSSGEPLEHSILWQSLDQLVAAFSITFVLVRTQGLIPGYRRTRELAIEGAKALWDNQDSNLEDHEDGSTEGHDIDQVLSVVSDEEIPLMAMKIWANLLETGNANLSAEDAMAINADIGDSELRQGERIYLKSLSPEKAAFVSRIRNLAFRKESAIQQAG